MENTTSPIPNHSNDTRANNITWVRRLLVFVGIVLVLVFYLIYSLVLPHFAPKYPEFRDCKNYNDCSQYCNLSESKQSQLYTNAGCGTLEGVQQSECKFRVFPGGDTMCDSSKGTQPHCICGVMYD